MSHFEVSPDVLRALVCLIPHPLVELALIEFGASLPTVTLRVEGTYDDGSRCPGCGSLDTAWRGLVRCGLPCDYGWHDGRPTQAG